MTCDKCQPVMFYVQNANDKDHCELCQLHAAAPELLEACRNALESLRSWNTVGLSGPAQDAVRTAYENSPEIRNLIAAIAKAEGQ